MRISLIVGGMAVGLALAAAGKVVLTSGSALAEPQAVAAAKAGSEAGSKADSAKQTDAQQNEDKQALQAAQAYVGSWRGVGQTKRGSADGSWQEEADWAWKFDKGGAALTFSAPKAKFFTAGRLLPGEKAGQLRLECLNDEGKVVARYAGTMEENGDLAVLAQEAAEDAPARITFRTVAGGDRLLVLLERRLGDTDRFLRMAEIGYTRKGSNFGQASVERECVVTGGAGTIAVTYDGKIYYVCCTGCRDFFNDDPAGVLSDYKAKQEEAKKERKP